ncbi:MAG: S1 family peptidase [Firmicutes bacterium]|nr:S1 family peptidase [Bacillota bacterium]
MKKISKLPYFLVTVLVFSLIIFTFSGDYESNHLVKAFENETILNSNLEKSASLVTDVLQRYRQGIRGRNGEEQVYSEQFAGVWYCKGGYLNVGVTNDDNYYTRDRRVEYKSKQFSYNKLNDVRMLIVSLMPQYSIVRVGITQRYNQVQVGLTSKIYTYQILIHMGQLYFFERQIVNFILEDASSVEGFRAVHAGERITIPVNFFATARGTISAKATCNRTGRRGILTNAHNVPAGRFASHHGLHIGRRVQYIMEGVADSTFIPFYSTNTWEFTSSAFYRRGRVVPRTLQISTRDEIVEGMPIVLFGDTTGRSEGYVSVIREDIIVTGFYDGSTRHFNDQIRHTAFSSPGDSGGPVYAKIGQNYILIATHFASRGGASKITNIIEALDVTVEADYWNVGWSQPLWSSSSNEYGIITASGNIEGRDPFGAFDGWVGDVGPGNAAGFGAAQWTKNARSGWIQITLHETLIINRLTFYNRFSGGNHRTHNAHFTGSGNVSLGQPFTGVNQNAGRSVIQVGGVRTNIIRLNITSSWGSYIGANAIIINATEIDSNEQPTPISTVQELSNIRNYPNGNFILTNNIDMRQRLFGVIIPMNWTPIPAFHGTLDGNGYTLSGLRINRSGASVGEHTGLGLFARLYGTVRNLGIENAQIDIGVNHNGSGWIVAGLVTGFLRQGGIIENVNIVTPVGANRNTIEVNRDRSTIGMIAGESHGIIRNSRVSDFEIGGNGDIGGIAGTMYGGTIYNNRVFGGDDIENLAITWYWRSSTNRSIGGIVGFHDSGTIHNNRVGSLLFDMLNTRNYGQLGTIVGRSMNGSAQFFFNNMSIDVFARDGLGTWFLEDQRGRVG